MEIDDMLCSGFNPTRSDTSDTRVYLEGLIADYYEYDHHGEKIEKVMVRVGDYTGRASSFEAHLRVGIDSDGPPNKYIAGRLPSEHSGDSIAMSRVKGWIETCDQTHKSCGFLSAPRPQPKRILDISKDRPIVVHTDSAEGRYVALSYCWGPSGKNVLLTSATFSTFTSTGIEPATLPKTVRDAITVCKSLGIYRLWVDALCIIQREPDLKDFIVEAPRMSDYYRNAYLTLIAGSAEDCAEGFLDRRTDPISAPCEISYERTFAPSDTDMTGCVKIFLSPSEDVGPIKYRAWTFQESVLSQRSLTYGPEQMTFSCLTMKRVGEDGSFLKVDKLGKSQPHGRGGWPTIHHLIRFSHDKAQLRDYAYQLWFGSFFTYTSRALSDKDDRLAAIAGFANLVQKVVQSRYMYGLWEDALAQGLLWKAYKPWLPTYKISHKTPITRAAQRAPSWSWASIDGPILHLMNYLQPRDRFKDPDFFRLKILSYEHVSCSFDPIREAVEIPKGFELAVCGQLRSVRYISSLSGGRSEFMLSDQGIDPIIKDSTVVDGGVVQHDPALDHVAVGTWDTYDDFESKTYCNRPLHALLLTCDLGLLLTYVDPKRYRRVGYFRKPAERLFKDASPEDIILI